MPKTFLLFDTTNQLAQDTHNWFRQRVYEENGMFIPNEVTLDYAQYVCEKEGIKCPYKKANKQTLKKFSKYLSNNRIWIGSHALSYIEKLSKDADRKQLFGELLLAKEKYVELYYRAIKEQQETYGAIGWYDWGKKYRGTKWNATLTDWHVKQLEHDKIVVYCDCETAWNVPDQWLKIQQEKNDSLEFFCYGHEEDDAYNGYFHGRDIKHWIKGDDRTLYETVPRCRGRKLE